MNNIDNFIMAYESNMIYEDDIALEGINWDISKMIKDADVKKARALFKVAKRNLKKKGGDRKLALNNLLEAKKLMMQMKVKVDRMDEPEKFWSMVLSHLTPIFTLMPSSELTSVTTVVGSDGSITLVYNYTSITDEMSRNTRSGVKENLQHKFNLFIKNTDQYIKLAHQLVIKGS